MAEGRLDSDYDDNREIYLDKPEIWTSGKEIREVKENKKAVDAVLFFRRYSEMGNPFGPWAHSPNPVVEIIEALSPLRDIYKPRLM